MNPVTVRNIRIGEGIPKVCIPLVGAAKEEITAAAMELRRFPADVAEWRADWFDGVFDPAKVIGVLTELRKLLGDCPLLFTFRTAGEGGEREISTDGYRRLNLQAAESGLIDLLDVEVFTGDDTVAEIIQAAHRAGVKVVASSHDFDKTPPREELISRMVKMEQLGADILKIAVMPQNTRDVLELLSATEEMTREHTNRPVITMSMSGNGVISRLAGEVFGSALTFGTAGRASAPGQIGAEELKQVLEVIHKSL